MGAAYLFYGPVEGGTFGRDDAVAILPARAGAIGPGQTVAVTGVGDANCDGYDDLWVGDPYGAEEAGTVVLLPGSNTAWEGVVGVGEAAFAWWGEHGIEGDIGGDRAGALLAPAGDVDGDGLADVLIGAGQYWQGGVGVAIYLAVGSQIPRPRVMEAWRAGARQAFGGRMPKSFLRGISHPVVRAGPVSCRPRCGVVPPRPAVPEAQMAAPSTRPRRSAAPPMAAPGSPPAVPAVPRRLLLLSGTAAPMTATYRCFDCGRARAVQRGLRLPPCEGCDREAARWEWTADDPVTG